MGNYVSLDGIEVTAEFEERTETVVEDTLDENGDQVIFEYTKTLPIWIIKYPKGEVREMHDNAFADHYKEVK